MPTKQKRVKNLGPVNYDAKKGDIVVIPQPNQDRDEEWCVIESRAGKVHMFCISDKVAGSHWFVYDSLKSRGAWYKDHVARQIFSPVEALEFCAKSAKDFGYTTMTQRVDRAMRENFVGTEVNVLMCASPEAEIERIIEEYKNASWDVSIRVTVNGDAYLRFA
jgi:hypothetical protein